MRGIDKETVVYIYMQQNIIWPLKNKILPFAATSWMDLEIITLEVTKTNSI